MNSYWKRYCFNMVMAVETRGGRPVESWCSVMLELIMFVVLFERGSKRGSVQNYVVVSGARKLAIRYLLRYLHRNT